MPTHTYTDIELTKSSSNNNKCSPTRLKNESSHWNSRSNVKSIDLVRAQLLEASLPPFAVIKQPKLKINSLTRRQKIYRSWMQILFPSIGVEIQRHNQPLCSFGTLHVICAITSIFHINLNQFQIEHHVSRLSNDNDTDDASYLPKSIPNFISLFLDYFVLYFALKTENDAFRKKSLWI